MLVWLGLRPSLPALRGAVAWLVARALWFLCTRGRAACYISTGTVHSLLVGGSFRFLSSMLVSSERSLPRVYGSRVESWVAI